MTQPQDNQAIKVDTSLMIHATDTGIGLLVSMTTEGTFDSDELDRRFYAISQLPPADLDPTVFWWTILHDIAGFLAPEPEAGYDAEGDTDDS